MVLPACRKNLPTSFQPPWFRPVEAELFLPRDFFLPYTPKQNSLNPPRPLSLKYSSVLLVWSKKLSWPPGTRLLWLRTGWTYAPAAVAILLQLVLFCLYQVQLPVKLIMALLFIGWGNSGLFAWINMHTACKKRLSSVPALGAGGKLHLFSANIMIFTMLFRTI